MLDCLNQTTQYSNFPSSIVVFRSCNLSFNSHSCLSETCAAHHSTLNPNSQKIKVKREEGILSQTLIQRIRHQLCRTSVLLDNVLERQFTVRQENWWLLLCCLVNSNNVLAPSAWQTRLRMQGKRYSFYYLSFKWLNSGNWIIANRSSYASKTPDRHVNMSF